MKAGSDEWNRLVTASKVAAILGVSPWESPRSMWHKMRGEVESKPQTKVQARGHYLEPAVLAWWQDQHPDVQQIRTQPTFTLGDWAAATPDAYACTPLDEWECLVEAKSAKDMDDWGDPGTDVIPAYYLVQAYWQMHVSRVPICYVPVIGPFLVFSEYVVEYDQAIGDDLEARCRAFYDSLTGDVPPELDDTVATYDVIRKLHPDIDKGEAVELTTDEAREFVTAKNDLKTAEARERLACSTVLERMARAQYATHAGQRIARRQPNKTGVSLIQVAKTFDTEGSAE